MLATCRRSAHWSCPNRYGARAGKVSGKRRRSRLMVASRRVGRQRGGTHDVGSTGVAEQRHGFQRESRERRRPDQDRRDREGWCVVFRLYLRSHGASFGGGAVVVGERHDQQGRWRAIVLHDVGPGPQSRCHSRARPDQGRQSRLLHLLRRRRCPSRSPRRCGGQRGSQAQCPRRRSRDRKGRCRISFGCLRPRDRRCGDERL